jgi:hypothetical protein
MVRKANRKTVKRGFPKRVEYMWRWKEDRLGWMISYPTIGDARKSALEMERPKKAKTLQIARLGILDVVEEEIVNGKN